MGKDSDKDYVINIENVKKAFGKNVVLKDVNLKVREGESIVTLGKSDVYKRQVLIQAVQVTRV